MSATSASKYLKYRKRASRAIRRYLTRPRASRHDLTQLLTSSGTRYHMGSAVLSHTSSPDKHKRSKPNATSRILLIFIPSSEWPPKHASSARCENLSPKTHKLKSKKLSRGVSDADVPSRTPITIPANRSSAL